MSIVLLPELPLLPEPPLLLLVLLLLLLLLPQPAMNSTPRTAAHDRPSRTRETWWYFLTDLLLLEDLCV